MNPYEPADRGYERRSEAATVVRTVSQPNLPARPMYELV